MIGNLFTADFLERGIKETPPYQALDDAALAALKSELSGLYATFPVTTEPNEAETERRLIYPVCGLLGWRSISVQQGLDSKRRTIPDACLFLDEEDRRRADHERNQEDKVRHADLILEAKRWNVPFDSKLDRETPPMAQLLAYLSRAETLSDRRVRWGMLTDGRKWRLCFQGAKSRLTDFLEIDLAAALGIAGVAAGDLFAPRTEAERDHALRLFVLFFRADSFRPAPDGRSFHQLALDEGRYWEARVKRDLSDTIFDRVFPELLQALRVADAEAPQPLTDRYLAELREAAFTFLYRLLFTLYAEDRELLPRADPDYDDYGLSKRVRDDIAERIDRPDRLSSRRTYYYDFCLSAFETIDAGDESVGVPPFNGGLFARDRAPLLYRARIPDARLAPLIDALSRTEQGGKKVRINYRDLSVRELGAVYERLLEREPVADVEAPAGIAIRLNPFARKGSGSYYTPDELVVLIIERTVGPLVAERVAEFEEALTAPKANVASARAKDAAEAILSLKICDPAMGSGHFLVALVDYLADAAFRVIDLGRQVLGDEYQSPVLVRSERIRTRIVELASKRNWKLRADMIDDKAIVRRMVLKRCVHGVDKNPMAVELAKVALWLHTLTAGAPLSFLDHHLRCGDSLFGEWVRPVMDQIERKGALLISQAVRRAESAAAGMELIEGLTDADMEEAAESRTLFDEVEEKTRALGGFLDFWHARRWLDLSADENKAVTALFDGAFGDPIMVAAGLRDPDRPDDEAIELFEKEGSEQASLLEGARGSVRDYVLLRGVLERAHRLAAEEHFLHWQLAFPRIWRDWTSGEKKGGFDAVIGNPPWDRMKMQEVEWFAARAPVIARQPRAADRKAAIEALREAGDPLAPLYDLARRRAETAARLATRSGDYPLLGRGDVNIYSLFVERAQQLIGADGMAGLLVPSGIASDMTASAFFRSVSTAGRVHALFDFENRRGIGADGRRRPEFFPDVDTRFKFCAFVVGGPERGGHAALCGFFLGDPPGSDDPALFSLSPDDFLAVNPNTGTAPIFRSARDAELTKAIYARLPVLVDRSGDVPAKAWPVQYATLFHMANDSHLFSTEAELAKLGAYPVGAGVWRLGSREFVPLIVGRMIDQFNHRYSSAHYDSSAKLNQFGHEVASTDLLRDPDFFPTPAFWVEATRIRKPAKYRLGFRDISRATDARSFLATLGPPYAYNHKAPLMVADGSAEADWAPFLVANANAFVADFVLRQKYNSTSLTWFIVEQLPVVPPSGYSHRFGAKAAGEIVKDHVLRLTYTAHDMAPFARDMGYVDATGDVLPPIIWDEAKRRHLRARLDALYFHLYGVADEADVRYILSTFPIVERKDRQAHGCHLTAELIVWHMRALAAGDTETDAPEDVLIRAARQRESEAPTAA